MTISLSKVVALGGLCALFASAGTAASAQGYGGYGDWHAHQWQQHRWMHRDGAGTDAERARLARLHRVYTVAARTGHYGAAERAHLHAQAIRRDLRYAHRTFRDDHGF